MIGKAVNFKDTGGGDHIINDRANQPRLQAQSPFYYISIANADGLYQSDVSYESHPIPNATGEKSGDIFRRGKTITLSGKIYGWNLKALETGADFLGQMFADTGSRKLIWTRWDGVQVYIKCRVNQDLAIVQSFENGKYEWEWIVGLRADNPFTYKVSDDSLYPTYQT